MNEISIRSKSNQWIVHFSLQIMYGSIILSLQSSARGNLSFFAEMFLGGSVVFGGLPEGLVLHKSL